MKRLLSEAKRLFNRNNIAIIGYLTLMSTAKTSLLVFLALVGLCAFIIAAIIEEQHV